MSTNKCNFCAENALLNELEKGNLYDPYDFKGPGPDQYVSAASRRARWAAILGE